MDAFDIALKVSARLRAQRNGHASSPILAVQNGQAHVTRCEESEVSEPAVRLRLEVVPGNEE